MNKLLKFFLIFLGALLSIYCIGSFTGALMMFKVKASSCYPTLKAGEYFLASNLKKPAKFDLVCYKAIQPPYGKGTFVSRICGLEGDIVQIKNGNLYVNKKSVDQNLPLALFYRIPGADFARLQENNEIGYREPWEYQELTEDTISTYIDVQRFGKELTHWRRIILPKEQIDESINAKFHERWNLDHFGPVKVPPGHCFILGDNRHHAMDSRYTGFIHKKDIVAVVIGSRQPF